MLKGEEQKAAWTGNSWYHAMARQIVSLKTAFHQSTATGSMRETTPFGAMCSESIPIRHHATTTAFDVFISMTPISPWSRNQIVCSVPARGGLVLQGENHYKSHSAKVPAPAILQLLPFSSASSTTLCTFSGHYISPAPTPFSGHYLSPAPAYLRPLHFKRLGVLYWALKTPERLRTGPISPPKQCQHVPPPPSTILPGNYLHLQHFYVASQSYL
jgi:hypothetical protein